MSKIKRMLQNKNVKQNTDVQEKRILRRELEEHMQVRVLTNDTAPAGS